ncbi:unnamed protein product [Angiostrongylus costaricensis]|uniref:Tubulin--tyrosine ligase-like protein 5 n=1 Tax=Angiostrongylus costaricensis TaxID=334426 RepID=A0A0R3PAJ3_ANGCS|nr:unnamed protein product [Angiostrongylus costaricensis]
MVPSYHCCSASQYLTFTPDSLNHISRRTAANVRERYTQTGEDFNLAFKMINSDTKLVKTVLHSHGFTQPYLLMYYRQRLNQFPRSTELTRKDKLYDNIRRSSSMFGNVFNFIPDFFVTPRDSSLLSSAMEHSMGKCSFIVKPVSSSRGQGIFFANKVVFLDFDFSSSSLREIPASDTLLVSRYLENPLLINGHKFDLRIYVAVTSFYPLVVYVYSEGLTRYQNLVASEKYCSNIDSRNAFVHLTNYSINKNNSNFVRNDSMASEDYGHKWTLGALLRHLEKDGVDSKLLMLRIEDIVVKSLLSVQARITSACRTTTPYIGTNYELFGFDILVDAQLKPWLLEVNLSPSLSCDAPLDSLVKTRLICDLFNLACVPLVNRKLAGIDSLHTFNENENGMSFRTPMPFSIFLDSSCILLVFHNAFATSPNGVDAIMRAIYRRARMELLRKGGFVRIFPREHSFPLYRSYFSLMFHFFCVEWKLRFLSTLVRALRSLSCFIGENCCFQYPSIESVPPKLVEIICAWHSSANAYTQKITRVGETYAARLPIVRPSARLRTKSCSEWYEVKKATLAEAKLKLRLQQEASEFEGPGR